MKMNMKLLSRFFLATLCVASVAACSDDDEGEPAPEYDVISFEPSEHMVDINGEEIVLKSVTMSLYEGTGSADFTFSSIYCGKEYATTENYDGPLFMTADGSVKFLSYYAFGFDYWNGIAVAAMPDMRSAAGSSKQQFSVWAEGGANNTPTYAVCYDSNTPSEEDPEYMSKSGYPTFTLAQPRVIDHLYIANSTYVYNYFQGEEGDLFQVKITGWKGDTEVGSTTETLISGSTKLAGWRKVNLASFGAVDKLVFKVAGIDITQDPSYFCIDEIALVKE